MFKFILLFYDGFTSINKFVFKVVYRRHTNLWTNELNSRTPIPPHGKRLQPASVNLLNKKLIYNNDATSLICGKFLRVLNTT